MQDVASERRASDRAAPFAPAGILIKGQNASQCRGRIWSPVRLRMLPPKPCTLAFLADRLALARRKAVPENRQSWHSRGSASETVRCCGQKADLLAQLRLGRGAEGDMRARRPDCASCAMARNSAACTAGLSRSGRGPVTGVKAPRIAVSGNSAARVRKPQPRRGQMYSAPAVGFQMSRRHARDPGHPAARQRWLGCQPVPARPEPTPQARTGSGGW